MLVVAIVVACEHRSVYLIDVLLANIYYMELNLHEQRALPILRKQDQPW